MNNLINNILDNDNLIKKIKDNFSEDDIQIFELNYRIYKNSRNNDFTIDLDEIYDFIGFTRKGTAKTLLLKDFKENIDYIINKEVFQASLKNLGGRPKEKILLNIDCFKEFCLTAATEQSKKLYKYYVKMEKTIFEYMEELYKNQNEIIQHQENIFNEETKKMKELMDINKHNSFIEAFKNKYVVYIAKIKDKDDKQIIKIGSTKEIQVRAMSLIKLYKTFTIIKVFECPRNEAFEKFLHKHQYISQFKYNDSEYMYNHELFLVSEGEFNKIIDIVIHNKFKFSSLADIEKIIEIENIKLEQLREHNKQTELELSNNKEDSNYIDPIILLSDNRKYTQVRGNKIQRYSADGKTLLKTYECFAHALRDKDLSSSMSISRPSIKNAIDNKFLYKTFRWAELDRNLDDDTIQDIGETVESKTVKIGYVAMLNLNKDEIVKVYSDQKSCSEDRHLTSSASVAKAIKNGTVCRGHYIKMYDDCDEELKKKYLENNNLPEKRVNGTKINQLHPINKNIIKVYSSVEDVIKEFKISRKTLKSACEFDIICKGYRWSYDNTII